MRIILIRHGDAVSSSPLGDLGRPLSIEGRRQAMATGRTLAEHGIRPTRAWCSPLVRAVQTAELVVAPLGYLDVVEARDDLYPDSPSDSLTRALARLGATSPGAEETVVIVGHQPYMSTTTSLLLNGSISAFATGAAYCLRVTSLFPHRAELEFRWLG